MDVELPQDRGEAVDIVEFALDRAARYAQPIAKRFLPIGNGRHKQTIAMYPHTLGSDLAAGGFDDCHFLRRRQHRAHANPGGSLMHTEKGEGIVMTPFDNSLDLRVRRSWHAGCSPSWPRFRESL